MFTVTFLSTEVTTKGIVSSSVVEQLLCLCFYCLFILFVSIVCFYCLFLSIVSFVCFYLLFLSIVSMFLLIVSIDCFYVSIDCFYVSIDCFQVEQYILSQFHPPKAKTNTTHIYASNHKQNEHMFKQLINLFVFVIHNCVMFLCQRFLR